MCLVDKIYYIPDITWSSNLKIYHLICLGNLYPPTLGLFELNNRYTIDVSLPALNCDTNNSIYTRKLSKPIPIVLTEQHFVAIATFNG